MTRNPDHVRAELLGFIRTAGLWHFDDGMDDQIDAATGERSFSAWEVLTVTQLLDEAFDILGDDEVWEIGMAELGYAMASRGETFAG